MIIVKKITMTPKEKADVEYAIAMNAQNAANIEYLSMMAGIDLDDDEDMENTFSDEESEE